MPSAAASDRTIVWNIMGIAKRIIEATRRWTHRGMPPVVAPPGTSADDDMRLPRPAVAAIRVDEPVSPAGPRHLDRVPTQDVGASLSAGVRAPSEEAARREVPSPAVQAFVASVRHLPLFSGTAMQLIDSIGRDDVTSHELTRLISTDAALVAHLLRIVNSPYYGVANRVGTIGDALSVLGFAQVRRTVTAAILQRPLMTYLHDTKVVREFWRHELTCAALARHLALRKGLDGEVAYMAGLMHDVGRLAMLIRFPEHTDVLLHGCDDDDKIGIDRECMQFGFDHARAGGALLELWGLPPVIVQAAYAHADETEPEDRMSASVWHANLLAHEMVDGLHDENVEEPWMVGVGLSVAERRRINAEIQALENQH